MADHPNKHIRDAVEYALSKGWSLRESKGHAWGVIYCSFGHRECRMSIYSTPRNPEVHARHIRKIVNTCPHED